MDNLQVQEQLLQKVRSDYDDFREKYGLKIRFEEFDKYYNFSNAILNAGYIPQDMHSIILSLISDYINNWINRIHNWLMPPPSSMIINAESNMLSENDKKMLHHLLTKCTYFSAENMRTSLSRDAKESAAYANTVFNFTLEIENNMKEIYQKIVSYWKDQSNNKE